MKGKIRRMPLLFTGLVFLIIGGLFAGFLFVFTKNNLSYVISDSSSISPFWQIMLHGKFFYKTPIKPLIKFEIFFYIESALILLGLFFLILGLIGALPYKCPACKKWGAMEPLNLIDSRKGESTYSSEERYRKVGEIKSGSRSSNIYETRTVEHKDVTMHETWNYKCICCGHIQSREVKTTKREY